MDVVAPGVLIPTTDRTGAAGYSSGDYALTFNGTSSATPHVAGVAALILELNPNLTQQEVVAIIDGEAVFYLERGGRTALVFTDDETMLAAAASALADALTRAGSPRLRIETVNGAGVYGSVLDPSLRAAGFRETPGGLRFDARR